MRPVRFLVVPLLVILGLLVVKAWGAVLEPTPVITETNDDLRRIVWRASVQADGVVAVAIDLEFRDDDERDLGFELPGGAQQVRVDGRPVLVSDFSDGPVGTFRGTASISYELAGAVQRFDDGALVDVTMYQGLISYTGLGDTEVQAVLSWFEDSSATITFIVPPLHDIRAERIVGGPTGAAVRFTSAGFPWHDATMLARLPASAIADAPVTDGSVDDAFDVRRRQLTSGPGEDGDPDDYTPVRQLVAAALLTIWFTLLLLWLVPRWRRAAADRAGATEGVPDEIHEPPSDLPPAVVGMLVGGSGGGDRSVVAGTLLGLAARREVRIDGIDSERFTLRIPSSTVGADGFERLLLTALRPQGQAAAEVTLTGPPLWSDGPHPWLRPLRQAMAKRARADRLVRFVFSPLVLLAAALVTGITALVGSGGRSTLAMVALIAGPILAIASGLGAGFALTRGGRRARAEWVAYGRFLRESGALSDLGVPAIAVWGPHLAYGAVLGVCPTVARALSPRFGRDPGSSALG